MRKLDIGPRNIRIDRSWETLDIIPGTNVDIVADILKPLPIENNTYDLVYLSHVLEHVHWYKVLDVLKELFRIIKHGGSIEIFVPDIDKIIDAYQKGIIPDGWLKYNAEKDPFLWFVGRLYTYGDHPSDFHKSAYNKSYLKKCLEVVGFCDIKTITKPRGYDHGYINLGIKGTKE